MKGKRGVIGRAIILLAVSVLFGMVSILDGCAVRPVKDGNDVFDSLLDDQSYRQELILGHTPQITVSLIAYYEDASSDIGLKYELVMGDKTEDGFIQLTSLDNGEWNDIRIPTHALQYVGKAELTLEAVGLDFDAGNYVMTMFPPNALQKDPECLLYKSGELVENGKLPISFERFDLSKGVWAAIAAFVILLLLCLRPLPKLFHEYPAVFATALVAAVGIINAWPFAGYAGHIHATAQYTFSWQAMGGFTRRALVGTILELLGLKMTPGAWVPYGLSCIAIMLILELCILYDKRGTARRRQMEKCWWLFLSMPFGVMAFFYIGTFGRFDVLLIIAFLLSCITIIKEKGTFLIPILSLAAILTHEMYGLLLFPFVFCLLLYKWYMTRKRRYLVDLTATSLTSVAALCAVYFIKPVAPFSQALSHIQEHNDPSMVWDWSLEIEIYDRSANLNQSLSDVLSFDCIPMFFMAIIFLAPVIFLAVKWFMTFHKKQTDKLGKCITLLFPLTSGGLLLSFYFASDYQRFCVIFGVGVFFSLLTLWSIDPKRVGEAVRETWHGVSAKLGQAVYPIMLLFYMMLTMLGTTSVNLFSFGSKLL